MLRTNKEWYNLLGPEQKYLFKTNCIVFVAWIKDTVKRDRFESISSAFTWNNTKQGRYYWSKIANSKD